MQRVRDDFLDIIQRTVPLQGKDVLDIGCGDGIRTAQIARVCSHVSGVDPDMKAIMKAQTLGIPNMECYQKSALKLGFRNAIFDVVIFTLSFHHIPPEEMSNAIDEALRVVKPGGHIIFFEPSFEGSFFEAEIRFGAFDGDERRHKALAYACMVRHPRLIEIAEWYDETSFTFDSLEDFVESMQVKSHDEDAMRTFLSENLYILDAQRRTNIFTPANMPGMEIKAASE